MIAFANYYYLWLLLLVPVIPQVVCKIDFENERIEIRPLEGLFD